MDGIAVADGPVAPLRVDHVLRAVDHPSAAVVIADLALLVAKTVVLNEHRFSRHGIRFFRPAKPDAMDISAVEHDNSVFVDQAIPVLHIVLVPCYHNELAVVVCRDLALQPPLINPPKGDQ